MDVAAVPHPEFSAGAGLADRLREVLAAAGYGPEVIPERLSRSGAVALEPRAQPRLLELTAAGEPIDLLLRLFLLGVPVSRREAQAALQGLPVEEALAAGLLAEAAGGISAAVLIIPFEGLLVLCDPPVLGRSQGPRPDHVHGMGRATLDLLRVTDRSPRERGLDLGTGCGIQGLLMARHTGQVLCTDVNPRALAIAAFNARLNGVGNVEFRAGSLFEPVAEERFDLIVANPPFAVSPGRDFIYRDGGLEGDGFVQALVQAGPGFLRPGGLLQATAQWIHPEGVSWQSRLRSWLPDLDCDLWILQQANQSPAVYAENWISETEKHDSEGYAKRWREWMEHLKALAAESISTGMIFIRRRPDGPGWFAVDEDAAGFDEQAGRQVAAGFRLRDFLAAHPDWAGLSAQNFGLGEAVQVQASFVPSAEGLRPEQAVLRQRSGILYSGMLDEKLLPLLARIEPSRPLGAHLAAFAEGLGQPAEALAGALEPMLRAFIERGFLVPVEARHLPGR